MEPKVHWHIGKEGTNSTQLDRPPFRAYFTRVQDGAVIDATDFSFDELRFEVARRTAAGEDLLPYAHALEALERA
jgi:hypothetical protein